MFLVVNLITFKTKMTEYICEGFGFWSIKVYIRKKKVQEYCPSYSCGLKLMWLEVTWVPSLLPLTTLSS